MQTSAEGSAGTDVSLDHGRDGRVIPQFAFCKGGSGKGLCYRRAMRAAPGLLVLGVAGALLAVALFFGRGSSDGRLFWIGIGASLAALVLVFATLLGFLPRPSLTKRGWWALGLFTAFVLWSGLTIAWSIAPDRSWAYLNRGLAYLAFVVLGLFVAALVRRPATWTAGVLAGLCLGVLGWALLGEGVPGAVPRRRPCREAPQPDRLLERPRARRRARVPARSLAGGGPRPCAAPARGRCRPALRRRHCARAHVLAGGHRRRRGGHRSLALARSGPVRGPRDARRCRRASGLRRRVGVDPAGHRRPPPDVGDAGTGRRVVRARPRARRRGRPRPLALRGPRGRAAVRRCAPPLGAAARRGARRGRGRRRRRAPRSRSEGRGSGSTSSAARATSSRDRAASAS